MKNYIKQSNPFIVPTDDGRLLEEHFGNASLYYQGCSVTRCELPPRWKDAYQNPEFDEVILIVRGKLEVEIDKEKVQIDKGESMVLKKGGQIRFRNPSSEPCEFYSICLPPFSLKTAHRG